MFIKKGLISLATLGVIGGTGTGVYYSLKEVNIEKSEETKALPNIVDNSGNNDTNLSALPEGSVTSSKSSNTDQAELAEQADLSTREGKVSDGVVSPEVSLGEPPTTALSGDLSVAAQAQEGSALGSQGSGGTSEEEKAAAAQAASNIDNR